MIKSMTGFGRAKLEINEKEYNIEIKSVNHKYSDVTVKIPKNISYLEEKVKKVVSENIARGKIDVSINLANNGAEGKIIKLNREIAKNYIQELRELARENEIVDDISVMEVIKLPDVLNVQVEEDDDESWKELEQVLRDAINNFTQMREAEGEKIAKDLKLRIKDISKNIEKINEYSTGLIAEYVVKLENRVKELLKIEIDKDRLMQEIVIYSDKCSIEEEITRLRSHIVQFERFLEEKIPIGKKMDFLIQEMNREINTIGSKAGCLNITNLVVEVKAQIENIREQIQNIE